MKKNSLFGFIIVILIGCATQSNCYASPGTMKWSFTADSAEDPQNPDMLCKMNTAPAIGHDGRIYMATHDNVYQDVANYLYAINQDGSLEWKVKVSDGQTPSISADGTIYVASYKSEELYAITQLGNIKWSVDISQFDPEFHNVGIPSIGHDGTIYITVNRFIVAISNCGYVRWSIKLDDDTKRIVTIGSNSIYVPTLNILYSISTHGEIQWKKTGSSLNSPAIDSGGNVYSLGGVNYYDTNGNYIEYKKGLFKIDKLTGDATCIYEIPYTSYWTYPPALGHNDTIYFRTRSYGNDGFSLYFDYLHAITTSGDNKWSVKLNESPSYYIADSVTGSVAIGNDGTIFTAALDGHLHAISSDGVKLWKFDTGYGGLGSSPAIADDGTIYVGSGSNKLFAISSESGPLAPTSWPMLLKNTQHTGDTENIDEISCNMEFPWIIFLPAIIPNKQAK